jgi:dephospho-CoA kinase
MRKRPYILGLTGSIGSGKSTTAKMFADAGVPVWDADAVVHLLYAQDKALIAEIGALAPGTVVNGVVDRQILKEMIKDDPALLKRLEAAVHPRVQKHREDFLAKQTGPLVVLDIPLLFEVGADAICDGVLVVTIPPEEQRRRIVERGSMTPETFDMILAKQIPLAEKAEKADFVIESKTLESASEAVHDLIVKLTGKGGLDA